MMVSYTIEELALLYDILNTDKVIHHYGSHPSFESLDVKTAVSFEKSRSVKQQRESLQK